ncbi:MAG: FixH family protein [Rhodobacterales bacterium]
MTKVKKQRKLTGFHVVFIFCTAFGVIIGVNLFMAYSAIGTFPGLETYAPYNESLTFQERRDAQNRLNWVSSVSYKPGRVILSLTEANGAPVVIPDVKMVIRRATTRDMDRDVPVEFDGHNYIARMDLPAGNWQARIFATALDGTKFTRILSLYIRPAS